MTVPKIAIIYYSTYGYVYISCGFHNTFIDISLLLSHVKGLVHAAEEGAKSKGAHVTVLQL